MMTPQFRSEFGAALEASKTLPPIEGFQACLAIAEAHNLVQEVECTADNFLVHEENRSKLMLTPMKSHKVGDQVHHAGADLKQIDAAYAFELSKIQLRELCKSRRMRLSSSGPMASSHL